MDPVTAFLCARIEEDEAIARAAGGYGWGWSRVPGLIPQEARYLAHFDPERVLKECSAKRRLIAAADPEVLLVLAEAYLGHPDYANLGIAIHHRA